MSQINLTERDQAFPGTATYEVAGIEIAYGENPYIGIRLIGENGEIRAFNYTGPEAVVLLDALEDSNAPIKNLRKLVLQRLVADGQLAGTVI